MAEYYGNESQRLSMEMSHRGYAAISIILGKLWDIIWNE